MPSFLTMPSPVMRCLTASLLCASSSLLQAQWEEVEVKGHKYVTVQSVKDFYRFKTMEIQGPNLVLENAAVRCAFPLKGTTANLNTITVHLEKPLAFHKEKHLLSRITLSKTLDPILRPSQLPLQLGQHFKTIILDPEGNHPDLYALAQATKKTLEARRFRVLLTRKADQNPAADQRLAFINDQPNAIVVSLRFRNDPEAGQGMRTWLLAPSGTAGLDQNKLLLEHLKVEPGNANDAANISIATALHASVLTQLKRPDQGIARTRTPLLAKSKHPSLIIDFGNLAHKDDAKLLPNNAFHQSAAKSLTDGIVRARLAITKRKRP